MNIYLKYHHINLYIYLDNTHIYIYIYIYICVLSRDINTQSIFNSGLSKVPTSVPFSTEIKKNCDDASISCGNFEHC